MSSSHERPAVWYVSTTLGIRTVRKPEMWARDIQIDGIPYRRLDPDFYAWLRNCVERMRRDKKVKRADRAQMMEAWDRISAYAHETFGDDAVDAAVRRFTSTGVHRRYTPPCRVYETGGR